MAAARRVHSYRYALLDNVRWGSSVQTLVDEKAYVVGVPVQGYWTVSQRSSPRVSDAIDLQSLADQVFCSIYVGVPVLDIYDRL